MFLKNKYSRWHDAIIFRARSRSTNSNTEKHHVLPKCCGGTDVDSNLVDLTTREHFVVHWLLTKMVDDPIIEKKLKYAFSAFTMNNAHQNRQLSSLEYVKSRAACRGRGLNKPKGFGEKIRLALTGKPLTEERKRKISEAKRGKKLSSAAKANIKIGAQKVWTDEKRKEHAWTGGKRVAIPVIIDGVEYPSLTKASAATGKSRADIKKAFPINTKIKT